MTGAPDLSDEPAIPALLRAAVLRYEQAIMDDDLDLLDAFFADDPATMRGSH